MNDRARATQRAINEHITVVGSMTTNERTTVWQVENPNNGAWYSVRRDGSDGPLTCTCKAASYGHFCKHEAAVMADPDERR